ncbi:MAG: hypothetical protein J6S67_07455 [Methanobrevibacter sp.]|nr:hypothetical protein [Methanobrevibacter sp.]
MNYDDLYKINLCEEVFQEAFNNKMDELIAEVKELRKEISALENALLIIPAKLPENPVEDPSLGYTRCEDCPDRMRRCSVCGFKTNFGTLPSRPPY